MQKIKRFLMLSLCLLLAFGVMGCGNKTTVTQTIDGGILGEGDTSFNFTIVDGETETVFEIHTNQTMVGDALRELGLIAGEEGPYGLYIKTVNGVTYDYDKDGCYWAFYQDGAYATTGVDKTEIVPDKTYTLKVEK